MKIELLTKEGEFFFYGYLIITNYVKAQDHQLK